MELSKAELFVEKPPARAIVQDALLVGAGLEFDAIEVISQS